MSENVNTEAISIQINNPDSTNSGGGGILDRVFDTGLKLLIPLIFILVLGAIVLFIIFVLPLISDALEIADDTVDGALRTGSLFTGAVSALTSWYIGRTK